MSATDGPAPAPGMTDGGGLLDLAQLREVIAEVSHWPGYSFTVYTDRWLGPVLFIVARVRDRDNPRRTTDLGVRERIPPVTSAAQLLTWLEWRLTEMAIHEVREGLRWRGELVDDPHA